MQNTKSGQLAFVTGGSGFLGRRLIPYLRERGFTVRALARSASAQQTVRQAGAEAVPGDLSSVEAMRSGMQGCSVVFHSAAKAEDWGDPAEFHQANVVGTENVLAAARKAGVGRLVHVGTEAVLVGGPRIIMADESWPLPAHPFGLYPITKGMAENLVRAANRPGFTTVVVRPRFIWGKGDTTVLGRMVELARKGEYAWIDGGDYRTSTCHVLNVCEGMLLAAERGQGGGVYFLTDGEPVHFRTFITAMLKTQGVDPGSRSVPLWLAMAVAAATEASSQYLGVPSRPPITRTAIKLIGQEVTVDDRKARRELGYQALVSQAAGLAELSS